MSGVQHGDVENGNIGVLKTAERTGQAYSNIHDIYVGKITTITYLHNVYRFGLDLCGLLSFYSELKSYIKLCPCTSDIMLFNIGNVRLGMFPLVYSNVVLAI